jgi:hypothetical protein
VTGQGVGAHFQAPVHCKIGGLPHGYTAIEGPFNATGNRHARLTSLILLLKFVATESESK